MSNNFQLVIHIVSTPIQFPSPEAFAAYVETQIKQGGLDDVGQPAWKKFEHLPLLKIVDDRDPEKPAFTYKKPEDLPTKTVANKKGVPLIIIG